MSKARNCATDDFVLIPQEDIDKLNMQELKEDLKKCGIKGKGKKSELKEQLEKRMHAMLPVLS
eukprot:6605533-Ditylum_brightwellii.AAC.1